MFKPSDDAATKEIPKGKLPKTTVLDDKNPTIANEMAKNIFSIENKFLFENFKILDFFKINLPDLEVIP